MKKDELTLQIAIFSLAIAYPINAYAHGEEALLTYFGAIFILQLVLVIFILKKMPSKMMRLRVAMIHLTVLFLLWLVCLKVYPLSKVLELVTSLGAVLSLILLRNFAKVQPK